MTALDLLVLAWGLAGAVLWRKVAAGRATRRALIQPIERLHR